MGLGPYGQEQGRLGPMHSPLSSLHQPPFTQQPPLPQHSHSMLPHVHSPPELQPPFPKRRRTVSSQEPDAPSPPSQFQESVSNEVEIVIEEPPPVEVRTRTPSENRNFGLTIRLVGNWKKFEVEFVKVLLAYADSRPAYPPVDQSILGGIKVVSIADPGRVVFDHLCMSEASTKHEEREFCLEFVYILHSGQQIKAHQRTTPFYAFSHKKVLTRRKNIVLRALSKASGSMKGGEELHVIGTPFVRGPSLKCVISTSHGDTELKYVNGSLERFSETVVFFKLPPYPGPKTDSEAKALIQMSNDGRNFSNALSFTYKPDPS